MFENFSKQIEKQTKDVFIEEKLININGLEYTKLYKKIELLGQGGFASCYKTQSIDNQKIYATKIIPKKLLTNYRTKLRLMSEIKLHQTFHHQNIVQFIHYFEDQNNVYIFLQLCENLSLNQVIDSKQGRFTIPQMQSLVLGIVNGLQYLKKRSIIHRDLKPGNIFINKQFQVKIGDFGLATKLQFKNERKRTVCGTPNYISPEVLEGQGYCFQIDVWGLGVIIYTLYYGIPPFETQQAAKTYVKIKSIQYSFPIYPIVPIQALQLIRRIFIKDISKRITLEEILNSNFMRLGKNILKELHQQSFNKLPLKNNNNNNNNNYNNNNNNEKLTEYISDQKDKINENKQQQKQFQYITRFEQIIIKQQKQQQQQKNKYYYYYEMNNYTVAIIDVFKKILLCKDKQGKFMEISLITFQVNIVYDHQLKIFIDSYHKNTINNEQEQISNKKYSLIYISKFTKIQDNYLFRLSNKSIQINFKDGNYLLNSNNKVYQIKQQKIFPIPINILISNIKDNNNNNNNNNKIQKYQHYKFILKFINRINLRKKQRKYNQNQKINNI